MTISFQNGMSIITDTDFKVVGIDGSSIRAQILNSTGVLEKGNPVWRNVFLNVSGQYDLPAGIVPLAGDYGGEGNHYNFSKYKFICPVLGNYRMSIHSLITGPAYANPGAHLFGYINGSMISCGAHMAGDSTVNYMTAQWVGVVRAAAGDALYFQSGGGRVYGDGWTVATYQLLG